jgi:uncharacterized protein (TIGR02246 family)
MPMRNSLKAVVFASVLLAAACNPFPTTSTTSGGGETVDLSEVRTAVEGFAAKFNARDAAGASAIYANDPAFHWIEGGRLGYGTRDAAVKGLSDFLAGFPESRLEFHNIRVDAIADSTAVATVDFRQTVAANGQTALAFEGVMTLTMVKRDGEWKVIVGHSSTGQLPR